MVFRNIGEELEIQIAMDEQRKIDEPERLRREKARQEEANQRELRGVAILDERASTNQSYCVGTVVVGERLRLKELNLDLEGFNLEKSRFEHVRFGSGTNLGSASLRNATFQTKAKKSQP